MSYYIGQYGHIKEHGGKPDKEKPLSDERLGCANSFEDKERAIFFRDQLREHQPTIFLRDEEPEQKKTSRPKALSQDDFSEEVRKAVSSSLDTFMSKLSTLAPDKYVDGWLKLASFGFSRAPSAKTMDEDERQKQADKESKRKEDLIRRGIQTEDMED